MFVYMYVCFSFKDKSFQVTEENCFLEVNSYSVSIGKTAAYCEDKYFKIHTD